MNEKQNQRKVRRDYRYSRDSPFCCFGGNKKNEERRSNGNGKKDVYEQNGANNQIQLRFEKYENEQNPRKIKFPLQGAHWHM